MSREPIRIPAHDWGATPVQLQLWLVEIGDEVECGDGLAEVSIPGLTGDVTAPVGGRVVELQSLSDRLWSAGEIVGWIEVTEKPAAPARADQ